MQLSIDHKAFDKFLMVGDKVLVKPTNPQVKTRSGLLLPPLVQEGEKLQTGYVIRIGPGYPLPLPTDEDEPWKKKDEKNTYLPLQAKEGDLAVYLQSSAYEVRLNDEKYLILPHSAILMLVRDKELFEEQTVNIMNKIVSKEYFSPHVVKLEVEAPLIARSRKAGHFVIVRVGKKGERIPLTIAASDTSKGTITLVVQAVGRSSKKLCELNTGESITDLVGPLGQATHIEKVGTVVCAGGGVGVAPLLPIVEAFHRAGNRVIVVLAARTKELVILEKQMRACSDEVLIMTDDGSYGTKGLVTNGVESVINREPVNLCVTIGPAIMMKFVSELTKKYQVPTVASLNTIMVDGTGMCGACRVTVGGQTKFVCVDGPEFDAHQVDFDEMMMRLNAYKGIDKKQPESV